MVKRRGQSAAGAAIDQLLSLHPASAQAQITAKGQGKSLPVMLADLVLEKADSPSQSVELAQKYMLSQNF